MVVGFVGLVTYEATKNVDWKGDLIAFIGFSKNLFLIFVTLLVVSVLLVASYSILRTNKERNYKFKNNLENLNYNKHTTREEIEEKIANFNLLVQNNSDLAKKYHELIRSVKMELNAKKKELEKKENEVKREKEIWKGEERIRLQKERIKKLQKQDSIKKLSRYFKNRNSDETIPRWAIKYDSSIINEASQNFKSKKRENKYKEEKWLEVVEFVSEHKAYPSSFNDLSEEYQAMYKKALRLLKKDKLNEKIVLFDKSNKLFYFANNLSPEKREELISKYGYRHKPFIFRDGRPGNNLIIKNDPRKESDYHFCMKYLFSEIDKEHSKVEYHVDELRADVAFVYSKRKIAIEIETGSNKELQISKKVG